MATSVAETLAEAAGREGVDVGDIGRGTGGREAIDAHLRSDRGDITVTAEPDGRLQVLLAGTGFEWARGWTSGPAEAVRAIALWRTGARLRELAARFPFLVASELGQAHEDGRGLDHRWQRLLGDPALAPLARALHDNPVLGALGPSVSHGNFVRLELGGRGLNYAEVHVIQLRDGFQVGGSWDETPRLVPTIDEAVAEAVALVQAHTHGG